MRREARRAEKKVSKEVKGRKSSIDKRKEEESDTIAVLPKEREEEKIQGKKRRTENE